MAVIGDQSNMSVLRARCKLIAVDDRRWGVWSVSTKGGNLAQLFSWKPGQSIRDKETEPLPVEQVRAIVEFLIYRWPYRGRQA